MKAIRIVGPQPLPASTAEAILRRLPSWFGIEAALVAYAREAESYANFVAVAGEDVVGFVTLRQHNPVTVELHCLAVEPSRHRQGVGARLCSAAATWWKEQGGKLIEVKTLGPSRPNESYAKTRAFYEAMGYLPVEEFQELWPGNPCLLLVKSLKD